MSAAERLQTLVEEFWEDTAPSGHEAPVEVVRALPQIVAVVKAAENVSEIERTGLLPDFLPLATALAALDEQLP